MYTIFLMILLKSKKTQKFASAGNRTRVARVAGEHSTTEPLMLLRLQHLYTFHNHTIIFHIKLTQTTTKSKKTTPHYFHSIIAFYFFLSNLKKHIYVTINNLT